MLTAKRTMRNCDPLHRINVGLRFNWPLALSFSASCTFARASGASAASWRTSVVYLETATRGGTGECKERVGDAH